MRSFARKNQTDMPQTQPTLKVKLGLILVAGLILIWYAAYFEIGRSRASFLHETERSTVFEAQAFAENTLSNIKRLNEVLYDLREYWKGGSKQFSVTLQRRLEYMTDLAFQVAVIDEKGYLAYSNLTLPKDRVYLGDREHFTVHRKINSDRLFISKPLKGKVSGKWSIQFTRPILFQGRFNGVLVVSVSPEIFTSYNEKLHLGAHGVSTIVMDDGAILARQPGNEAAMGKQVTGSPYLTPDAPLHGSFTAVAQTDGIERIYGYYRIPEYGLNFTIGHGVEEVLAPHYRQRQTILTAAWIGSGVFALLMGLLLRSLSARAGSEKRLQDSQAMLRSAIDTIGEAFVIYDPEDRLAYCNEEYREIYHSSAPVIEVGRSFEEIIRYGVERGQYADAIGREEAWITERLAAHRLGNQELIQKLNDGRWLKITERRTPSGHIVGFRVDVTELFRAKEAAEAATVAKSRFLSTMSHEIRTPMNGILGMAQMLLMPNTKDEERQDYVRIILTSGQSLLSLLNDILDISKVEAGKLELESAVLNPAQIVHETQVLFAETAGQKGLRIESDWVGEAGQRYLGDPHRLRQMLDNLVGNAIKFTAEGLIRIAGREVDRDDQGVLLEFVVSDTGVGISPEKQTLLFKPFSQTDSSTTRQYGGSGLGLSIVRSLAELMGGSAGVESEAGRGSRFWFRIRVEFVPGAGERRAHRREAEKGDYEGRTPGMLTGHILVVEDNEINRTVINAMLSKRGLRCDFAEDGQQALEAITGGMEPDLILMDCQMPVMDGFEATRRIRRWEAETARPRLPIVAITAGAFDEDRKQCIEAGMDDFIAKPIDAEALFATVARRLSNDEAGAAESEAGLEKGTGKVFDPSQLIKLARDDAGALLVVRGVVRNMADNSLAQFADARRLWKQGKSDEAARAIHSMRGSFGTLGAVLFAAQALVLEKAIPLEEEQRVAELFDTVEQVLIETADLARSWLEASPAIASAATTVEEDPGKGLPTAVRRPLHDVPGFDVAAALARIDGDVEGYHEFLTLFRDTTGEGIVTMGAAMKRGDAAAARLQAHSLKGSAGAVGAVRLQAAAAELENSLKDSVIDGALLEAIEAEWKQAQASLVILLS